MHKSIKIRLKIKYFVSFVLLLLLLLLILAQYCLATQTQGVFKLNYLLKRFLTF